MELELTAVPLILHSYVPLDPASMVMEFTLIAVVLPIAAAHRLLGFALTAEGAHAFSWQAIWWLDTGATIAAGHLRAGVLQSCRHEAWERRHETWKQGLFESRSAIKLKNTPVNLHSRTLTTAAHWRAFGITGQWLFVHYWKLNTKLSLEFVELLDTPVYWPLMSTTIISRSGNFAFRML